MDLTPLMKPKSIAVVGASPRMNRATRVITNLQRFGYSGWVFPNREGFRDVVASVRDKVPQARLDGVLVQRMIAGGTEMILGVKRDPLFGPAIVCGFGGIFTEILRGARGRRPADVRALGEAIVGLAALAEAHREGLRALDLNPLLVLDEGRGVVAVDWLIEFA